MLLIVRKNNESIIINDDIKITVVEASNGRVRLGIEAPRSVPVHRLEIYDKIKSGEIKDNYSEHQGPA